MPRMKILNTVEKEAFESPPFFHSAQRKQYFDFPVAIQRMAESLRTPTTQLCFLLSCGYFKASKRFFPVRTFRLCDINYVAKCAGIAIDEVSLDGYAKQTLARHQALILDFYGFMAFRPHGRPLLVEEIARLVRSQLKPKLILWRCVDILVREKVEVPGYFRLAALILSAINRHNLTLVATIERTLAKETRELLDRLLIQESGDDGTPPGKTTPYKLTLMKKLSQSTKPSKIKERVGDLDLVAELYQRLQPVLTALALSHDGIRYYAHSVIKSEIFQLTRREAADRYLHLIAFIAHQYYRLQDNLVDGLLTSLQSFQNGALREHKEPCYARREQRNESLKALVGFLEPREPAAVAQDGKFRVSLSKALLFLHVPRGIQSGPAHREHSYKYRPLADYRISRARWPRDQKEVTASHRFRRRNSYAKPHARYPARKAFGPIPKSRFILRWIDAPARRPAIEKQRDRIEHAHRVTRALSVGNPRAFLQAEKAEQALAEACQRLVQNGSIGWNDL